LHPVTGRTGHPQQIFSARFVRWARLEPTMETTANEIPIPETVTRRTPRAPSRAERFYDPYPTMWQIVQVAFMPAFLAALILVLMAITPTMGP
jgi:hypothetical protein